MLCGAKGSGKSSIGLRAFVLWASTEFRDEKFILCAKTWLQIRDVFEPEVGAIAASIDRSCRSQSHLKGHHWTIPSFLGGWNTFTISVFGEGENPVKRLIGPTYQGAYVDEANNMQKSYRQELNSRVRRPHSRIVWTLNPDAEKHTF